MSRRRYLSTDAGRDKALNKVAMANEFACTFYLMAIPHAGDDATLPTSDPEELLYEVCPGRRDKGPEDVEAALALLVGAGLFVYREGGQLSFPPASYYRYQTYIREDRRGAPQRTAPETAHGPSSIEAAAQNSAQPRTSAQNVASFSSSFNPSFSSSSPTAPTEPTENAAPAPPDAPLAPVEAAIVPSRRTVTVYTPTAEPTPSGEHGALWDAFTEVFGEARGKTERQRRGEACKRAREAHATPEEIGLAAAHWPNVMGDATLTELGMVANLGKLLHGPQVNGRSKGTTVGLHQQATQRATLRLSPEDELAQARRGR